MENHTKGPWKIYANAHYTAVNSESGKHIAMINYSQGIITDKEHSANAALVRAAPELLAACKEFVRKCECGLARSKDSYAQMKAAIEKTEEII